MSVYRDMLKKVDGQPTMNSPERENSGTSYPSLTVPGMERLHYDLEALVSRLEHGNDQLKCIAFCGVDAGVGVSSIASSVASHFAELHPNEVIILNANSRSKRQSLFGSSDSTNTLDSLLQNGSIDDIPKVGALFVLNLGGERQTLGRLKPKDISGFIRTLKENFKWVIIDSPPAIHPESLIWNSLSDATIVVVQADKTRRQAAQSVAEQLIGLHVNVLGCILNRRKMVIPGWLYQKLFK